MEEEKANKEKREDSGKNGNKDRTKEELEKGFCRKNVEGMTEKM